MYIRPTHWPIALVISMIFGLLIGLFLYEQSNGNSEDYVTTAKKNEESYPECNFTDSALKSDELCSSIMTYREYDAIKSSPNEKYTLYSVKEGQNGRAVISRTDWKVIGDIEIPVCRILATTKHVPWCWDEETLQPMLVAYHTDGTIVTIAANNYFDIRKGYKIVSLLKDGVPRGE